MHQMKLYITIEGSDDEWEDFEEKVDEILATVYTMAEGSDLRIADVEVK